MKYFTIAVITSLTLAACAEIEVTRPPVNIVPLQPNAAVGLDVYGQDRARGARVPQFRGQDTVTIRTFGPQEGGGHGEIANLPCRLDTEFFKADFFSPAYVVVPNYGRHSQTLSVQCTYQGKSVISSVNAINLSDQRRRSAASGATVGEGLFVTILLGGIVAAQRNDETDEFGYPSISVRFPE